MKLRKKSKRTLNKGVVVKLWGGGWFKCIDVRVNFRSKIERIVFVFYYY